MTFIRRAVFLCVVAVAPVFAQTGVSLETEIQNIETSVNRQEISPVQRHSALVRLARLRQLSGDIEGAAKNWLEAAAAIPGSVDDDALLSCAYCLAAMGEWDKAAAALDPLLPNYARARFLNAGIIAVKSGDISPLAAIAADPEYSLMKSEIYFMLWKTSRGDGADLWRQRLIAEFPQSTEGQLAAGGSRAAGNSLSAEGSRAVFVRPSPFWLLIGGLDSLPIERTETAARPTPQSSPAAQERPASAPATPQSAAVRLQAGLFSRETNAQAHMANLRQAGFSPSIEQRGEMWAVTVPAGTDANRAIRELKDAGFDSFPIR